MQIVGTIVGEHWDVGSTHYAMVNMSGYWKLLHETPAWQIIKTDRAMCEFLFSTAADALVAEITKTFYTPHGWLFDAPSYNDVLFDVQHPIGGRVKINTYPFNLLGAYYSPGENIQEKQAEIRRKFMESAPSTLCPKIP